MEEITLVAALKKYFEIEGSQMIKEFKALNEKDKQDFCDMFQDIGWNVSRPLVK